MNILQIALLIIVILLLISFIFYKKVIHVTSLFIVLIFFASLLFSISAIFLPGVYKTGAELVFKDTPFAQQLKNADGTFTEIGKIPANIINSIGNIFGGNNQTQEFKTDLYNQFIDFAGSLIRIMVLIFGLILMLISVYVRYSYSGVIESEKLSRKLHELEKEVNLLKGIRQ